MELEGKLTAAGCSTKQLAEHFFIGLGRSYATIVDIILSAGQETIDLQSVMPQLYRTEQKIIVQDSRPELEAGAAFVAGRWKNPKKAVHWKDQKVLTSSDDSKAPEPRKCYECGSTKHKRAACWRYLKRMEEDVMNQRVNMALYKLSKANRVTM